MAWLGRAARRCGRTAAQLRRFARSRRSSSQTDRRHELGDLAQVVDEAGVLARPLSLASGRRSETGAWQGSREASPGEFLVELVLALTFERDKEIVGKGPSKSLPIQTSPFSVPNRRIRWLSPAGTRRATGRP